MAATLAPNFRNDERGSIAIMFGLMIMVLMSLAGLALDYSRILLARHALNDAADAAGIAVGRAMVDGKVTTAEAIKIGEIYFAENAKGVMKVGGQVPLPSITSDEATSTVTVTARRY